MEENVVGQGLSAEILMSSLGCEAVEALHAGKTVEDEMEKRREQEVEEPEKHETQHRGLLNSGLE